MHRTGPSSHCLHDSLTVIDRVVAVEPAGQSYRVFIRGDHGVIFQDYPFFPFLLLSDPSLAETAPVAATHHHLAGNGKFCWLVELATWRDWCLLREHLQQLNRPDTWFAIPDSCQQFLVASGITFFRGLALEDLKLLCISLQKDGPSICSIAVTDGYSYHEVISNQHMAEAAILERLTQVIQKHDPDVITGYHLNKHDLPAIIACAQQNKLQLRWGRNGSEPHQLQTIDRRTTRHYELYGRSLIDLATLMRHYDRHISPVPGGDLQHTAKWFGCTTHTTATEENVLASARKTIALYLQLAPPWFLQAQLYPVSYQKACYSPVATAAHALLTREYLRKHHALPAPTTALKPVKQTYEPLFQQGQVGPVIHCNFSALPAAIIAAYRIAPHADELQLFPTLLSKTLQHNGIKQSRNAIFLTSTWYELLANSNYPFSDSEAAAEVDRLRHVIIRDILAWLREAGAKPVAIDDLGIYFVPPYGHGNGSTEINRLLQRLCSTLPHNTVLHCTGSYASMFIYKSNQFALLDNEGQLIFRESSFISHSMEPFLKEFLRETIRLLLTGQGHAAEQLYEAFVKRLTAHSCPVTWVMRTETLVDSREHYIQAVQNRKRNHAAVYELAMAQPGSWRTGEKISYYVTGHSKNCAVHENCKLVAEFDPLHPDLNISWYIERLHQLFNRFRPFIPAEPLLFE